MINFLDNLRRKSEGERKTAAFIVAAAVTGIIFIVWLSVLFAGAALSPEQRRTPEDFSSEAGSFSGFQENLTELFSDVREQFDEVPFGESRQENGKNTF